MADNLPRNSFTIDMFEVIAGSSLLENLENGSLTRETAYSKKRKMAVRYHSEDIEECYHKVRRLNNYAIVMTVTDLEKNLDETQDELEEVIIGLQDTQKSLKQINEEMRRKDQELSQELRRKDEEMRQKDEEMRQEMRRKEEELRQELRQELRRKEEEMRQELRQELRRKEEELRQELRQALRQKEEEMRQELRQELRLK